MFSQTTICSNTLVYLTEFPTPIRGSFDPSYLELPKEILSTVMRHHQRYFSVLKDGRLAGARNLWRSRTLMAIRTV